MQKERMILSIESYNSSDELQPAQIADVVGVKRATCKGWIDALPEVFPPSRVEDSGYRFFGTDTLKRVAIVKTLKARPLRKTHLDLKKIFQEISLEDLWSAFKTSNDELKITAERVL